MNRDTTAAGGIETGDTNQPRTPLRAIRTKCLDCCCGSPKEVRLCRVEGCGLYPWRMGVRPATLAKRVNQKILSSGGGFHSQRDSEGKS